MTAIRASFSDFRTVKSRKVAQLVMEVPIEAADDALRALGGVPRPDVDRWVGIAPLTEDAATRPAEKTRRDWGSLTYAQQAGIRCGDPDYQAWLSVGSAEEAATHVRTICKVASRADLDLDAETGQAWRNLDDAYRARSGA